MGFVPSMSAIFVARLHSLICFSLSIAARTSAVHSK
jgi:hypothetical protein